VAQVDFCSHDLKSALTVAPKPTSMAQVDTSGRSQAHSGGTSQR
jgi:hypothetical protein